MPKIRHVAIASSDPGKLSEFYKTAFGMRQVQGMGGLFTSRMVRSILH